jgi:prepilin-type N-terminal cleavage/methylation domain-containing protein
MKFKSKQAFSLIELSIVILIIGIIIAGVTQSSKLLTKAQLLNAQASTRSSPVAGMEDLILWLEPTLNESFGGSSPDDRSAVAAWHDINPQVSVKNNATQATSDNQPLFISDCINGLPCVRFDGVQDATGDMLVSDVDIGFPNMTLFIVFSKIGGFDTQQSILGNGVRVFSAFEDSGVWIQISGSLMGGIYDHYANIASVGDAASRIFSTTLKVNIDGGSESFVNGSRAAVWGPGSDAYNHEKFPFSEDAAEAATRERQLAIGNWSTLSGNCCTGFAGNIAEIIIFNRVLKVTEREAVENYLGKKWQIAVTH